MKKNNWLFISGLLFIQLAVVVIYKPSLNYFFSQDDFVFLYRAQQIDSCKAFITLAFAPDHFYRPVPRVVYFVVAYNLFGLDAVKYHLTSMMWHYFNALLLTLVIWRLFGDRKIALFSGFIFGTHAIIPFLSVYWVSVVQDLSATTLLLIGLLCFLRFRSTENNFALLLAVLSFLLALFSKEIAVTFPVLLISLMCIPLRKINKISKKQFLIIFFICVFCLATYLMVRISKTSSFIPIDGPYAWQLTLSNLLRNITRFMGDALYLRFWLSEGNIWRSVLMWAGIMGLLASIIWRFSNYRVMIFLGLCWYLVTLAPVIFLPSQQIYSFYAYWPLTGMALVIAVFLQACLQFLVSIIFIIKRILIPSYLIEIGRLLFLFLWLAASFYVVNIIAQQDPAGILSKSILAQQSIDEVRTLYPFLPRDSRLYIIGITERDKWVMGHGYLFHLYYPDIEVVLDTTIQMGELGQEAFVYQFRK